MARHAQDREDLLRDAKAFVHRVEIQELEAESTGPIFAGFRVNGALSLYFDQDPVYHFNSQRQIRRAYWHQQLIKAEQGLLIGLQTSRSETEVAMQRHQLADKELQQFNFELSERLSNLQTVLQKKQYQLNGKVPDDSDIIERLQSWLHQIEKFEIADAAKVC